MALPTIKLPFKKETKNMIQYQAPEEEKHTAVIPTLYVRKDQFESDGNWPPFIEIVIKGVSK
jgi:peptide methionine sulfoxide reductase MsrB